MRRGRERGRGRPTGRAPTRGIAGGRRGRGGGQNDRGDRVAAVLQERQQNFPVGISEERNHHLFFTPSYMYIISLNNFVCSTLTYFVVVVLGTN